jgi:hypothetical protein
MQLLLLVESLRGCSMEELKQIDRAVASSGRNRVQQQDMQTTAEQFYVDALAIAGTRNTIAALVEVCLYFCRPIYILPFWPIFTSFYPFAILFFSIFPFLKFEF